MIHMIKVIRNFFIKWYINCENQKQSLQPLLTTGDVNNLISDYGDKEIKEIPQNQRKWVREEVVLLVSEYFRTRDLDPTEKDKSIEFVSEVLRKRAVANGETISEMFRNINGISMQFACIIGLDPVQMERGQKGLSKYSRLQKEIVNEYLQNPEKIEIEAAEILRKY